jgi:hypothetical protein
MLRATCSFLTIIADAMFESNLTLRAFIVGCKCLKLSIMICFVFLGVKE